MSSSSGFAEPITHFDVHFYYWANDAVSTASALEVWRETKAAFPNLRIYEPVNRPVGPHPVAMWEAHLVTAQEFGEYLSWLALHRRGHSVLVHANTGALVADHTVNTLWLGQPIPLNIGMLERLAH